MGKAQPKCFSMWRTLCQSSAAKLCQTACTHQSESFTLYNDPYSKVLSSLWIAMPCIFLIHTELQPGAASRDHGFFLRPGSEKYDYERPTVGPAENDLLQKHTKTFRLWSQKQHQQHQDASTTELKSICICIYRFVNPQSAKLAAQSVFPPTIQSARIGFRLQLWKDWHGC